MGSVLRMARQTQRRKPMRRMRIFARALTEGEIKEVVELLADAQFTEDEIEVVTGIGDPAEASDDDLVLVLLSEAVCADPNLEQVLVKTQNGGRAICVWLKTVSGSAAPPTAVHKYAYSVITWDAAKLGAVAA